MNVVWNCCTNNNYIGKLIKKAINPSVLQNKLVICSYFLILCLLVHVTLLSFPPSFLFFRFLFSSQKKNFSILVHRLPLKLLLSKREQPQQRRIWNYWQNISVTLKCQISTGNLSVRAWMVFEKKTIKLSRSVPPSHTILYKFHSLWKLISLLVFNISDKYSSCCSKVQLGLLVYDVRLFVV